MYLNVTKRGTHMKKILKNYGFIIMMLTGVIAGCIVGAGSVVITEPFFCMKFLKNGFFSYF